MKIVFSSRAKTDLAEGVKFIAYDKPQAAQKWAANIRQSVSKLSDSPQMGRMGPEYGDESIREIIKGQHRIVYTRSMTKRTPSSSLPFIMQRNHLFSRYIVTENSPVRVIPAWC
ncbi:type II toxin-antitoxin system RelE/ParE family toxin [candidate division KSB1 bacterium]|nr:type II toxin-antitoxin system RelE/ParE family toxin [candidate division KSB1 bacterium]NIR71385.1 type II toxin-antitoxin system RelE/ParE family toxin [candidate division KSB1 bacterium]NIS26279.1 type II toxin-antitoxin system RelE/ParE family toxin [candidate division KSB1 bacterium]NIT73041.1 type II toxin-antitoxin system RelE/ParE family toxin [candidate division KSB1 bacterium]NIU26949.1 type II toxin-antitoxin system RelE/ParE family toxin [candidate division KSB1 bacterium]